MFLVCLCFKFLYVFDFYIYFLKRICQQHGQAELLVASNPTMQIRLWLQANCLWHLGGWRLKERKLPFQPPASLCEISVRRFENPDFFFIIYLLTK